MIYVLVQDREDYDDCDGIVFAHTSKEVVEKVHDELVKYHRSMQVIAKRFQEDMQKINQQTPPPEQPNTSKLPLRPLVWRANGWQNAYVIDWQIEYSKWMDAIQEQRQKLEQEYATYYQRSLSEIGKVLGHLYDRTFSIEEIEDNPDIEMSQL